MLDCLFACDKSEQHTGAMSSTCSRFVVVRVRLSCKYIHTPIEIYDLLTFACSCMNTRQHDIMNRMCAVHIRH